MKKNKIVTQNYLDRCPLRNPLIIWNSDDNGKVTLEIENTGVFNRIAQKLLKKPRISYVHLDEIGSLAWLNANGEKTITEIGEIVKSSFGEKAEPLYERLAKYFQIHESYNFIIWKE